MVDIIAIIEIGLVIIGGATVAFRSIAPLTKTKADDSILKYLEKFLAVFALNKATKEVVIKIK